MNYSGKDILDMMSFAINYNNFLRDIVLKEIKESKSALLDFGSGCGTFAKMLKEKGIENITCLEIDEELNQKCKKDFNCVSSLEQVEDNFFDLIYSFNVLEHIEDDFGILKILKTKLKEGGEIIIYVPACNNLFCEFDKKVGHFRRYDKKRLKKMFEEAGIELKTLEYQDFIGFLLAYIYKFLNKKNGEITKNQILIFDRILFPISRFLDKVIFSKIIGKNLLTKGRK
jgi:SAM-dependent methyltransferase